MIFRNAEESHQHALQTLNTLYEFDDFMMSIGTLCDMGCGEGLDLAWWANRTTRELDNPKPLDIKCTGVDLAPKSRVIENLRGVRYIQHDFESELPIGSRLFDVIWCHDTFQYVINPLATLRLWREIMEPGGMLCLVVPQTTNLEFNTQAFDLRNGQYYHHTLVSLIHMLAVTGWDCAGGFFRKLPDDPWIQAVVYRSEQDPCDARTTTWYDLAERGLLPESAVQSIMKHGYLRQRDLTLPWIDKSFIDYRRH